MCQSWRSGAEVSDRGSNEGVGLRWGGTKHDRFVVILLALSTGFGLYFVAGLRGVGSWLVFALASMAAVSFSNRFVSTPDARLEVAAGVRGPATAPSSTAEGAQAPAIDVDRVDYLRALRHEFRTPLNAVLGFSDVLLSGIDGAMNPSQQEDLEIVRASGIRLRVLLDSALDISQLADGDLRLDLDRVDVRDVAERAAGEARQLWSNKRIVRCTVPEQPCLADADEARLRRSILVLADFLATSHREAEIEINLSRSEEQLSIELSAVPAEQQTLEALPTTGEVLAAEDVSKIRQWPVAVTSELIAQHRGSLYHGSSPVRFRIRLPAGADS